MESIKYLNIILLIFIIGVINACNKTETNQISFDTEIIEMELTSSESIKLFISSNSSFSSASNYNWGVCYGNTTNPTLKDIVIYSTNNSSFNYHMELIDLTPNTEYFARLFVENKNDLNVNYSLNCSFTMPKASVGDFKEGGVVFWVNPNDASHGLVCSPEDWQPGYTFYWSFNNNETGAINTEVGTGLQNTNAINSLNALGAAMNCSTYSQGGYDDWYLPSKDELNIMYSYETIINNTASLNGGSDFQNYWYWSSTEYDLTSTYQQNFNGDGQQSPTFKQEYNCIRPIRSF
jgi:hypothetical protein